MNFQNARNKEDSQSFQNKKTIQDEQGPKVQLRELYLISCKKPQCKRILKKKECIYVYNWVWITQKLDTAIKKKTIQMQKVGNKKGNTFYSNPKRTE